ncbi:polycomb protein Asx [Patella vulgata]|uniref:polycomb protein Asx n=1 Tax=Patella vulgata TaxID=6465 RepID=UPI00218065A8|nr:polycomb protein Asx [Patella vulgata]
MQENTPDNSSATPALNTQRNIRQSPRVKKPKIISSFTKDGTLTSVSSGQTKTNGHTEKASGSGNKVNNHASNGPSQSGSTRLQGSPPKTLQEKLAATPGFSMKPRRRGNKRKSFNAQLAETKEGAIDLTPDSFLVNINLKSIIDSNTFARLPPQYQQNLIANLPECDKLDDDENNLRMSSTALNNEFFAKACQEWRERLSDAEFTPENQQRLKQEQEKELMKLDPWKAKHFEPVWGQRSMVDVPKATGPSPLPKLTLPVPQVKPKPNRSSMLVSQMLRKRDVSRTVAAKLQASTSSSACLNTNNSSISLSMPVTSGLLTMTTSQTSTSHTDKTVTSAPQIKTEVKVEASSDSGSPVPVKKQKVVIPGQPVQAQAKTLAQIRAQTQAARLQKSGGSVIQSQLAAGLQTSQAKVLNTATVSASFRLGGQTRTLAQYKAQTPAVKSIVNVIPVPQTNVSQQTVMRSLLTDPNPPHNKAGGQTRTLAQIKARTKQAQMKAAQCVKPVPPPAKLSPESFVPKSPDIPQASVSVAPTKPQTIIISPAKGRPPSHSAVISEQQKLANLQRSHEICKAEFEKSRIKQESPTSNMSKLVTASTTTTTSVPPATSEAISPVKTIPKVVTTTPTKDPTKQKILIVTSNTNSLSQPNTNTVYLVNAPVSSISSVGVGANQFVDSNATTRRIITIPAPRTDVITSTNSQGIGQIITSDAVRAILANTPPRASSAPPNHVNRPSDVITIVRSASVDTTNTNNNPTSNNQPTPNQEEISLNLNPEQLNFLSKAGTVIPVGRNGSQMKVITRPSVTVVEPNQSQSVVQGTFSVKGTPTTMESSVLANGNKLLTETQVANLLARPVLSSSSNIQNVQMLTSGQNITNVILQGGTTLPITVTSNTIADGGTLLNQSSCACSLKAMVMCQKCGAFCHDDCIGPSKLCVTCLITT